MYEGLGRDQHLYRNTYYRPMIQHAYEQIEVNREFIWDAQDSLGSTLWALRRYHDVIELYTRWIIIHIRPIPSPHPIILDIEHLEIMAGENTKGKEHLWQSIEVCSSGEVQIELQKRVDIVYEELGLAKHFSGLSVYNEDYKQSAFIRAEN
jgi:hypothetical protein